MCTSQTRQWLVRLPQARLARNRENAQLSRQRKKVAVQGLEQRCSELQAHNAQLTGLVGRLTAEVAALRFQLATVCQQAGRPMPQVPSALAPFNAAAVAGGMLTRPLLPTPVAPGVAAAAAFRTPMLGVPGAPMASVAVPGGTLPKVPAPAAQPALAAQRPPQQQAMVNPAAQGQQRAPAPAAAAAAAAAADAGKGQKRARTAGRSGAEEYLSTSREAVALLATS
jgi:hypothetical protein